MQTDVPKRRRGWLFWTVLGLGGCVCLVVGFVILAVVVAIREQLNRADTGPDFVAVAKLTASEMYPRGVPPTKLARSEAAYLFERHADVLGKVAGRSRALAPVALEQWDLVRSSRVTMDAEPDWAPAFGGAALVGLGAMLPASEAIDAGLSILSQQASDHYVNLKAMDGLLQRRLVNQLRLAELAPRFSGPVTPDVRLNVGFQETGLFSEGSDTIFLVNASGRDLSNCVVSVRLQGAAGETMSHVHFVGKWPSGQEFYCPYPSGLAGYLRQTVKRVRAVGVQVFAQEASSEWLEYTLR